LTCCLLFFAWGRDIGCRYSGAAGEESAEAHQQRAKAARSLQFGEASAQPLVDLSLFFEGA
jgi:hypothetical protein